MSEQPHPKLKMTVADALDEADTVTQGLTVFPDATGPKIALMVLAQEVRRLRQDLGFRAGLERAAELCKVRRDIHIEGGPRYWAHQADMNAIRAELAKQCGDWDGKKCPKCGCSTLNTADGKRWCSSIECDWVAPNHIADPGKAIEPDWQEAKAKVLGQWPEAFARYVSHDGGATGYWYVYAFVGRETPEGEGETELAAWIDAARRLEGGNA